MVVVTKKSYCIVLLFSILIISVNLYSTLAEKSTISQISERVNSKDLAVTEKFIKEFDQVNWLPVTVRLKDNSGIKIEGIKEQRQIISKQRREWYKPVIEEVLSSLPKSKFKMTHKLFNGFSGEITKEGFENLLQSQNIEEILWEKTPPPSIVLSQSVPSIDVKPNMWNAGYTGAGKKVCVIDTGVDNNHSDLVGKIVGQYCYCSTPNQNYTDCCPNHQATDTNAVDDDGHGTNVIGIIASQNSVNKGVAHGANILAVKVMNSTGGMDNWGDLASAIVWCRNQNADVISMSLGDSGEYSSSLACPNDVDLQEGLNLDSGTELCLECEEEGGKKDEA